MLSRSLSHAMGGFVVLLAVGGGQEPPRQRFNPIIELLEQKKPVFGVYAPGAGPAGARGRASTAPARAPGRGEGAAANAAPPPARQPIDLAREALAYADADFLFNGSMERGVDRGLPAFTDFMKASADLGVLTRAPALRLRRPIVVKAPKISSDPAKAIENISRELNTGVAGIMFVEAESADEVRRGLAAMRFASRGGTRPDATGMAPSYWGMTESQYKERADVWPLNPDGELINWTIVESKEGLAHVREIAAVKGIGVLWPGAGTLRGVFSTTDAAGERVVDTAAWENAIQQVLAACREFNVPCGFPANASDIELRMKQGFSVFVMSWGEAGFAAVSKGRQSVRQGSRGRARPSGRAWASVPTPSRVRPRQWSE
jgi:2-keto-3-deoxy-L-rhamnonate aldolase RhmA